MSRFIVVEGVDGAGKTTLIEGLRAACAARGHRVVCTREPGGTPLAEEIRRLLKSEQGARLTPRKQLELVHFGRLDHVRRKIAPALADGAVVLCDRYELSSWVYQVVVQPELKERFFVMQSELRELIDGRKPEYLLLDLLASEVQKRLENSEKLDHFDVTDLERIQGRRVAYFKGIRAIGSPYHILDALLSPEELVHEALRVLDL